MSCQMHSLDAGMNDLAGGGFAGGGESNERRGRKRPRAYSNGVQEKEKVEW